MHISPVVKIKCYKIDRIEQRGKRADEKETYSEFHNQQAVTYLQEKEVFNPKG